MKKKKTLLEHLLTFLGEIIIIVIGVTVSITMNDWQKDSTARENELELLNELKANLVLDSINFSQYAATVERNINWGVPLVTQDRLNELGDSLLFLVSTVPNYVPFEATTIGYTYLKESGGFSLVKNKALLKNIIQVYSKEYKRLEMLSNSQSKYIHEQIIPYYNKQIPLIKSPQLNDLGSDLRPFMNAIRSQEYRNTVKIHLSMMSQYLASYRATLEKIKIVLKQIEEECKEH